MVQLETQQPQAMQSVAMPMSTRSGVSGLMTYGSVRFSAGSKKGNASSYLEKNGPMSTRRSFITGKWFRGRRVMS